MARSHGVLADSFNTGVRLASLPHVLAVRQHSRLESYVQHTSIATSTREFPIREGHEHCRQSPATGEATQGCHLSHQKPEVDSLLPRRVGVKFTCRRTPFFSALTAFMRTAGSSKPAFLDRLFVSQLLNVQATCGLLASKTGGMKFTCRRTPFFFSSLTVLRRTDSTSKPAFLDRLFVSRLLNVQATCGLLASKTGGMTLTCRWGPFFFSALTVLRGTASTSTPAFLDRLFLGCLTSNQPALCTSGIPTGSHSLWSTVCKGHVGQFNLGWKDALRCLGFEPGICVV